MTVSRSLPRFAVIDALRALACLAVVLYHAKEGGHIAALQQVMPAFLLTVFEQGSSGVSIFFVISGFVIAHSMYSDNVTGGYAGRFMLRRSLRLDPPYWASIALGIAGAYISAKVVPGKVFSMPSFENLLLHVTYLIDIAGQPMVNGVYWTLCLEMQFYLSFVLLMWIAARWGKRIGVENARKWVLLGVVAVAMLWTTPWQPFEVRGLFLDHWHLFVMGVLIRYALDPARVQAQRMWCVVSIVLLGAVGLLFHPTVSESLGVASGLFLLAGCKYAKLLSWSGGRLLQWLGLISYSLYLTHNFVTGVVFRIGYKLTERTVVTELLWLVVAVVACCLFAWAFFLVFERVGLRLSKMVPLRPQRPQPAAVATPVTTVL
jgi:peptidoglycan/LPS O-acetylase OafA/YrhL